MQYACNLKKKKKRKSNSDKIFSMTSNLPLEVNRQIA